MTLIDGNKKKDIGKGIRYTTREFSGDFSLNNPIGIYIYNEKYAFGIAGKADFYYFKVTTTNHALWRFAVTFIYAFIFSILKIIALKCKIRSLYNVLLFIYYIY